MDIKTVGLVRDHAGYEIKEFIRQYLERKGISYKDYGTNSTSSCDYPDHAHALANAIEWGDVYPGIGVCGSGEGMSMTLNKHQGIRAGLTQSPEIAHLTRPHSDANVLALPGRFIDKEATRKILDEFSSTDFEGGRHSRRTAKICIQQHEHQESPPWFS